MWSKREHSSTTGGNANLYNHFGNQCGGFSGNWESTYLRIQQYHSWVYTPKNDQSYYKIIYSTMFIAALFVIGRIWKQPRCPSTEEWIKKMWHIYTLEYYSVVKNIDILNFVCKWMELENNILSEVTQTQKDEYGMYSLISGYQL